MKLAEIREKEDGELRELSTQLRDELFRMKMQHYTGQLDKPSRLSELRKSIARVETILRSRQIEAAP